MHPGPQTRAVALAPVEALLERAVRRHLERSGSVGDVDEDDLLVEVDTGYGESYEPTR